VLAKGAIIKGDDVFHRKLRSIVTKILETRRGLDGEGAETS